MMRWRRRFCSQSANSKFSDVINIVPVQNLKVIDFSQHKHTSISCHRTFHEINKHFRTSSPAWKVEKI
ncbi:hypothetical protein CHS0354_031589 [Potamilus streckersoni]|uniref:Uncharacterized protein n=1 Tax=Potamilus streckersoni TaxID=2493646 RepID=A0AAE0SGW7_9BIVA|nr:hypothetical protein CHS0354_031589 [Potamilus streckersoni]